MLTPEIQQSIDASVLCWLATIGQDGAPNVSPKEAWTYDGQSKILIAHIASPVSVANIQQNENVCVSFLDVFVQKGCKIKGIARVLEEGHERYTTQKQKLTGIIGHVFPILSVIEIEPTNIDPIIAPSYYLYPETQEKDQIQQALKSYRVAEYLNDFK
jgi:predicted pyridoxine 5'-phosphate oxidase superfamily flavin-nucleotide-binding protein